MSENNRSDISVESSDYVYILVDQLFLIDVALEDDSENLQHMINIIG